GQRLDAPDAWRLRRAKGYAMSTDLTIDDGRTSVVPGTSDTYTIVVSNTGPSAITGASVSDALPAGATAASRTATTNSGGASATGPTSGSGGLATTVNLPVNASVTFTFTTTINPSATGSFVNAATVTPPGGTSVVTTDTDTLTPVADLSVAVTDGKTTVVPGTSDTYSIVVANNGPSTVSSVTRTDTTPAALLNPTFGTPSAGSYTPLTGAWSGLSLASGQSVSITLSGVINPSATGTITNTVTVVPPAGVTDNNVTNNTATDTDTPIATPTLTTATSPNVALSASLVTLSDTATLSGGSNPTGTLTFQLRDPGNFIVDVETVPVNGNGTYITPVGFTLPTTGTVAGTWAWHATYSGNPNNNGVSASPEQTVVSLASPGLSTTASPGGIAGTTLTDIAQLSGGYFPTGTITFQLTNSGGVTVDTETVTVNGNGTYTTPTGFPLPAGTAAGTWAWHATYPGNTNNNAVASNSENETEGVNPSPPPGTTADMILRASNTSPIAGQYEIYDIGNNAILAASVLGQVGTDFQFAGLGSFFGS